MKPCRACILTGIVAVLAAGALGTMVAAQPSPPDQSDQHIAGWTIGDTQGFGLSMSHQVGINRIEYVAYPDVRSPSFLMETHIRGENCIVGDPLVVGAPAPTERARRIRAEMERRMVSVLPRCALSPAENAALIDGIDAAYSVYAARFERLRSEADRDMAEQANLAAETGPETNGSTDATSRPHS